ncbi:MAG: GPW/gp25 family protein [Burkholderia gladioli]
MQVSDIHAIPTRFFQPALSRVARDARGLLDDALGQVVTDVADIEQCISIILFTPQGSDPHRPTFGCNVDRYIDMPIDTARPYLARDIRRALTMWEPRLDLVRIEVLPLDIAQLGVRISWQISADYSDQIFVTNLALGQLTS